MTSGRKLGNAKLRVTCGSKTSGVPGEKVGTKVSFTYTYIFIIGFRKLIFWMFVIKNKILKGWLNTLPVGLFKS